MKEKYKYVLIAVGVLLLIYLLFQFEINNFFGKIFKGKNDSPSAPSLPGGNTNSAQLNYDKVLKRGVKGNEVATLQKWLKEDGKNVNLGTTGPAKDGIDGDFGPLTETALLKAKGVKETTLNKYRAKSSSGNTGVVYLPKDTYISPNMAVI